MALIRARHEVFGVCRVGEAKVRLHPDEWTPLTPLPPLLDEEPAAAGVEEPETAPELDEPEVQRPAVRRSRTTAAAPDTED